MDKLDRQTVGRLGELAVEKALTERGWLVGNFNTSVTNAAAYDLFAIKGSRRITIRVKAFQGNQKRVGEGIQYTARKDDTVFKDLNLEDDGDFVVIARISPGEAEEFYVLPTRVVEKTIQDTTRQYYRLPKKDGDPKKPSNHRVIDFCGEQTERSPHRGFQKIWAEYREAWHLLESNP